MIHLEDILLKCLKTLHPCNYLNTNQVYLAHNVCSVYVPELPGHVQSDDALFINISAL